MMLDSRISGLYWLMVQINKKMSARWASEVLYFSRKSFSLTVMIPVKSKSSTSFWSILMKYFFEKVKDEFGELEDLVHVGEDGFSRVDEDVQEEIFKEEENV